MPSPKAKASSASNNMKSFYCIAVGGDARATGVGHST